MVMCGDALYTYKHKKNYPYAKFCAIKDFWVEKYFSISHFDTKTGSRKTPSPAIKLPLSVADRNKP